MAGRGPAPKQTRVRPTDDARRRGEFTVLRADGVVRGPELPAVIEWPEQTLALWEALRTDAAASTWTDVDWRYLVDTMLLHADLWSGNPKVAAEIRLRLSQYGCNPDARLRLRMLVDSEPAEPVGTLERLQAEQEKRREWTKRKARLTRQANAGDGVTL